MEENAQYKQILQRLAAREKELHAANEKRIRAGIQCLIFIPMLFLFLLFLTESSKVIFLALWIISLFLISSYLIYVEYMDFQARERLLLYQQDAEAFDGALIGSEVEQLEDKMLELLRQIEEKKAESRRLFMSKFESKLESKPESEPKSDLEGK